MPYRAPPPRSRTSGSRPALRRRRGTRPRRAGVPLDRFRAFTDRLGKGLAAQGLPPAELEAYRRGTGLAAQLAGERRYAAALVCLDAGREYGAGMARDGAWWGRDLARAYEAAMIRFARVFLKRLP